MGCLSHPRSVHGSQVASSEPWLNVPLVFRNFLCKDLRVLTFGILGPERHIFCGFGRLSRRFVKLMHAPDTLPSIAWRPAPTQYRSVEFFGYSTFFVAVFLGRTYSSK